MSESIQSRSAVKTKEDLPPPRDRKGIRSVKPPLSRVSFARFNQYMAVIVTALLAFYAWRLMAWKAEAGGWWNLMVGRRQPVVHGQPVAGGTPNSGDVRGTQFGGKDATVEERINDLAAALGMPSKDLASAIASAVHEYVPPATLSSVAAHQSGEAVQYLVDPEGAAESDASARPIAAATKGFKVAQKAFEAAVGMDEPPSEMS